MFAIRNAKADPEARLARWFIFGTKGTTAAGRKMTFATKQHAEAAVAYMLRAGGPRREQLEIVEVPRGRFASPNVVSVCYGPGVAPRGPRWLRFDADGVSRVERDRATVFGNRESADFARGHVAWMPDRGGVMAADEVLRTSSAIG